MAREKRRVLRDGTSTFKRRSKFHFSVSCSLHNILVVAFITGVLATLTATTTAFAPSHPFSRNAKRNDWIFFGAANADSDDPATSTTSKLGDNASSIFSTAASNVKKLAQQGSDNVKSAASASKEGIQSFASATADTMGVRSVLGAATGGGKSVASSTVKTAADAIYSGIGPAAVKKAVGDASSNISGLAQTGSAAVKTVAVGASSSLAGFAKRRAEDCTSVVQWLETQAKDGATAANTRAQSLVLSFTGKKEYQFGDIAKEVVRRASSSDYNIKDMMLILRLLLTVGASFTPLAKLLPLTVLLEMLNESIEARIGGKVVEVLAGSLDERFVAALDAEELGDFAKRSLSAAIVLFTGKETYKPGDIKQAVTKEEENGSKTTTPKTLDVPIGPAFEDWDRAFRESHPGVDLAIEESLNSSHNATMSAKTLDMEIVRLTNEC